MAGFLQSIGALGPTLVGVFTAMKVQSMLSAKDAMEAGGKTIWSFCRKLGL